MDLNIPPSRDDPNITEQEARRASLSMANKFPEMDNNVKQGVAVPPTMPLNPLTTDPTTELGSEDIFRMKRLVGTPSEAADQSAVSIADSTSNFAAGDGDEMVEEDGGVNGMSKEVEAGLTDEGFHTQLSQNCIICGDYVFGRNRPKNPQLNKETVTEFSFPFEPLIIPGMEVRCETYKKIFLS